MAGPIMRTFWTVEGKVDKDGHPIEYPTEAAAKTQSSAGGIAGTGFGPGPAATPPTKVTESMTEDGEYVQTVDGPDGQPQEIGRGVDKARLELYNARRGAAKDAAPDTTPKTITTADGRVLQYVPPDKEHPNGSWIEAGPPKALGPAAPKPDTVGAPPTQEFIVSVDQYGKQTTEKNPNYKPAAGPAPGTEAIPAARPGQTTDLAAVKSQAQMTWDSLTADVQAGRITPEQRTQKWNSYYTATVAPALEAANREAVAEAERQRGRQTQADTIAQQAAARAGHTEERQ
jgi:hypothetical protein